MDKAWVDFIDYWNNIYWLLEAVIDIYCDLVDLYYLDIDIKATVSFSFSYFTFLI